jgi:hypothetical protein
VGPTCQRCSLHTRAHLSVPSSHLAAMPRVELHLSLSCRYKGASPNRSRSEAATLLAGLAQRRSRASPSREAPALAATAPPSAPPPCASHQVLAGAEQRHLSLGSRRRVPRSHCIVARLRCQSSRPPAGVWSEPPPRVLRPDLHTSVISKPTGAIPELPPRPCPSTSS